MKIEEITILSCKMGKLNVMGYHHIKESRNYQVDNDELPHPDMLKSIRAFDTVLASALYAEENVDNFVTSGFVIHEKNGTFSIEIKGRCITAYSEYVNISSGKIVYEEAGDVVDQDISDMLMDARYELWEYMFNGKNAQQKISFPEDGAKK